MTIDELLEQDGIELRHEGSTNGGELSGPCPFCGEGEDRLRVWPNHPRGVGGRFWCRRCRLSGDAVSYLQRQRGMDYRAACDYLETTPASVQKCRRQARRQRGSRGRPRTAWQEGASELLANAVDQLWQTTAGAVVLGWLARERGLRESTVRSARLGYLHRDLYRDRDAWGLPRKLDRRTGERKKLWIPPGLVIPLHVDDALVRVRIRLTRRARRPRWLPRGQVLPKYRTLDGSQADVPLLLGVEPGRPTVIVESDLDALLLHQEAGDLVGVVALGSAAYRPPEVEQLYRRRDPILVSLDGDGPGDEAARRNWVGCYGNGILWSLPAGYGKDPTEAWVAGLDLRSWAEEGVATARQKLGRRQHVRAPAPF